MHPLTPLFLSSGDLLADRRYGFARDLLQRGEVAAAADLLSQTTQQAPGFASAWCLLGETREQLGDRESAVAAFEQACQADPQDRHGAALHLQRLGARARSSSDGYISALFDQYAPRFDGALVDGLRYRGPELLFAAVKQASARAGRSFAFEQALDLGCGTGLTGAAFREVVRWLDGVDLSEGMIAQAAPKNLYDDLSAGEIGAFLQSISKTYDLVLAADVFVYIADLRPILAAAARRLGAGGLVAFTTETHEGEDVLLRETLRYAHGAAHVKSALASARLSPLVFEAVSTREEKGVAVPGLLTVAHASTAPSSPR